MAGSTFLLFARLPPELQLMVWKEFAHAEAASRAVVVHTTQEIDEDGERRATLHLMPPKRLVSPLLAVNVQSRGVALRHYKTRVNLFELPPPLPTVLPFWLNGAEDVSGPRGRAQCQFPGNPAWGPEQRWADHTELLICGRASELLHDVGTEAEMVDDTSGEYAPRGCVYLDLETDRFLFFDQWAWAPWVTQSYGLRALSVDAFTDLKYHQVPLDYTRLKSILDRRPPVLRNTSAALPGDVLKMIRNVVFEDFWSSSSSEEEVYGEGPQGGRGVFAGIMGQDEYDEYKTSPALRNTLPRAFSANGWLGGFVISEEVQRCFFDDLEDKGPEHLDIRKAMLVRGPGTRRARRGGLIGTMGDDGDDLEKNDMWWWVDADAE
ncbi:hypothetical protein PG993_006236 [Apiospora rasikravindrae]|uniref:2EXR domain-containing protein n=1 Tax=Apiospora rasikravindrae TaxID=990691 RepID=A0ABR1T557_9PEZI